MSLRVDLRHVVGPFQLDVHVDVGPGLTALVGPSGAGKTTMLNAVAGVIRPTDGRIAFDEDVLVDTAARLWQAPHRRGFGYVFQEPRLFPHLTVRRNLLYGRWFRRRLPGGLPLDEVIALLNLSPFIDRYPSGLSGGERQRVALGRALLARPRLLLMDEPLAAIDDPHRQEILPYLDRVCAEHAIPSVYVTHAWREVAGRADRVIRLDAGTVVFNGAPADAQAGAIAAPMASL
jgi:molybdate transport system ATP-binding protein